MSEYLRWKDTVTAVKLATQARPQHRLALLCVLTTPHGVEGGYKRCVAALAIYLLQIETLVDQLRPQRGLETEARSLQRR